MSKTTYTPVLKKKYKSDSTGIINVRVTKNRSSLYYSTRISLHQRFWNDNGKDIEGKLREQKGFDFNERLFIIDKVEEQIDELKKSTSESDDPTTPNQNEKTSFLYNLKEYINFLEQRKQIGTSKRYRTTLYHINKFLLKKNKTDLTFKDLNSSFVEEYETYLLELGIKINTTKNYINCIKRIYKRCVGKGFFFPVLNPFVEFKTKRESVNKEYLQKKHVEVIMNLEIDRSDPMYDVRNYFIFQIFGQGLRVSDLLTLRFSKVIEGNIKFFQYKTKDKHTIFLTPTSMWILKDYIKSDEVKKIVGSKFPTNEGKVFMTIQEIKNKYKELRRSYIDKPLSMEKERGIILKEIERMKSVLDDVSEKIFYNLVILLHNYSKEHKDDFIFPIINPQLFEKIDFNSEKNILTKKQYNHLQSKTTIYNRNLKILQKISGIGITLTTHVPRHTYTNLMIEIGGDVYEISKSLGHQGLKTTQTYIKTLEERISDRNEDLGKNVSFMLND